MRKLVKGTLRSQGWILGFKKKRLLIEMKTMKIGLFQVCPQSSTIILENIRNAPQSTESESLRVSLQSVF